MYSVCFPVLLAVLTYLSLETLLRMEQGNDRMIDRTANRAGYTQYQTTCFY